MIPVRVEQLFLSNLGFVVILKTDGDERSVPIFIGASEAQAIALQMQGITVPRPLTHDLLKNVLDYLECRLNALRSAIFVTIPFTGNLWSIGVEKKNQSTVGPATLLRSRFEPHPPSLWMKR